MEKILGIGASIFIVATMLLSTGVIAAVQQNQQASIKVAYSYDGENYLETLKTDVPAFGTIYAGEQPTDWTPDGVYIGVWGVKINGNFTKLGYLAGYYKGTLKRGSYVGAWNTTDNSYTGRLVGAYRNIFTIGRINITGGNRFPFVGFLLKNATHFGGKIMPAVGDQIIYVYGRHQPLNNLNCMNSQINCEISQSQCLLNKQAKAQNINMNENICRKTTN